MKESLFSIPIFVFIFSLHLEWFLVLKNENAKCNNPQYFLDQCNGLWHFFFFQDWNCLNSPLAINFPPHLQRLIGISDFHSSLSILSLENFLLRTSYVTIMPHLSSSLSRGRFSSQQKWSIMQLNKVVAILQLEEIWLFSYNDMSQV